MKIADLEKYYTQKGYQPFCVNLLRGGKIKWFVFEKKKEHDGWFLIIDSEGRAYQTDWASEEEMEKAKEANHICMIRRGIKVQFGTMMAIAEPFLDYKNNENSTEG